MREGIYDLPSGLSLSASDSNVTYRSYGNEKVTLRGGSSIDINDFDVASDVRIKDSVSGKVLKINLNQRGIVAPKLGITGHSSYYTALNGYGGQDTDSTVYADGKLLIPARYPNDGYMAIKTVKVNGDFNNKSGMSFTVDDDEYLNWQNATDAFVSGFWFYDWSNLTTPVQSISNDTITTTIPSPYGVKAGQRFYIYNLLEELDAPGEWFYDKLSGDFFIYPPENAKTITIASEKIDIVSLKKANSVNLYGLNIECSGYDAINVSNSKYVNIIGCKVRGASRVGIVISGSNNLVENCDILSTGNSCVSVSGGDITTLTPSKNTVKNCILTDAACLERTYAPNVRINGVGAVVEGNIISGNPHSAIIFSDNDHQIINNDISNVVYEASDMGAIYAGTSGISRGNIIAGNNIHDIESNSLHISEHNVYGVYLDDCFASADVYGNTFKNIKGSGVFINGGRDNSVKNNTFINIDNDAVKLSTAGVTDWYGDDESFVSGKGYNKELIKSVPYQKYQHLANILIDNFRYPKYNEITGNVFTLCGNNINIALYNSVLSEEDVRRMNTIQ